MADQLVPTTAAEYRKVMRDGVELRLATGRPVRMRLVELSRLYTGGKIPSHLTNYVAGLLWYEPGSKSKSTSDENIRYNAEVMRLVAKAALVDPEIVDNPKTDSEISFDDLFDEELSEIYRLANSPAKALESFRRQQAEPMAAVSDLQDAGAEAE